ncbi:hypothetical protein DH2020_027047 [Rehmannia glutinosa]|uniref:Pectinesterase inhibitor domain-containing protein n=1 Tax=Rehmannia glutinosa TaxID=99300 RepID=A0ABR0VY74_REHGL
MASTKTTICFTLALLATAAILSTAADNPFCATSDDQALCGQLTNGAHTWAEAMINALNGVMDKARAGKSVAYGVGSKLPVSLKDLTRKSIDGTCRQAYDNIIDNIKQCIGFVKNDPFSSLDTYLSATTFSDCTDGLQEFGVSLPEVADFDKEMLKLSSVLLAVAQKKASGLYSLIEEWNEDDEFSQGRSNVRATTPPS